jgi:hypothetical protein
MITDQTRKRRVRAEVAAAVAVVVIAALTLTPQPVIGRGPSGFNWCVGCGDFGGLDVLNNILLFLPLGAALAVLGWRRPVILAVAASMSLAIELLQLTVVPGRYASAGDVLMNTVGAAAGIVAAHTAWRQPDARTARRLCAAVSALVIGVLIGTAALLHLDVPDGPLYSQWLPRRAVRFTGHLDSAALNGHPLDRGPLSPITQTEYTGRAAAGDATLSAVLTPAEAPRGFAPVIRVVSDDDVQLAIGQRGRQLGFTAALRSRRLRLRTINLLGPDPVPASTGPYTVTGGIAPGQMWISVASIGTGRLHITALPLTAGIGWAFLTPINVWVGAWASIASGIWLAILLMIVGFYSARARSAPAASSSWCWMPAAAIVGVLILLPRAFGISGLSWIEWLGAACGWGIGASVIITRPIGTEKLRTYELGTGN